MLPGRQTINLVICRALLRAPVPIGGQRFFMVYARGDKRHTLGGGRDSAGPSKRSKRYHARQEHAREAARQDCQATASGWIFLSELLTTAHCSNSCMWIMRNISRLVGSLQGACCDHLVCRSSILVCSICRRTWQHLKIELLT